MWPLGFSRANHHPTAGQKNHCLSVTYTLKNHHPFIMTYGLVIKAHDMISGVFTFGRPFFSLAGIFVDKGRQGVTDIF
jgi:hypothetical protein